MEAFMLVLQWIIPFMITASTSHIVSLSFSQHSFNCNTSQETVGLLDFRYLSLIGFLK